MAITFKKKCAVCRENYVTATNKQRYVVCYDCQKGELKGEIKDPKMKKLFDIPEEFYKKNPFLRDIKSKYLKYGELSERQIEVFKEVVEKMKKSE